MTKENLLIIDQRELFGKQFRMYGTVNNPLFLAKDVANWIGHSDVFMMLKKIDEDEKLMQTMFVSGQNRECWFLTENGLYEVLMQSRKPIAKEFKREVKVILREIRLTGGYIPSSPSDTDEDILARAIKIADNKIKQQAEQISEYKPKAEAYDTFIKSQGCVSLNKVAKGLNKGRNKMNKFLRQNDILFKDGTDNIPYQKFVNSGYFKIDFVTGMDGKVHATTRVYPKGIEYIHKLYQKQDTSQEVR